MKRSEPLSIKELIDKVLDDDNVRDKARAQQACYLWPEIVGAGINKYTTRRYVTDGIMHVYLSSAPLKNEMQFHRQRLVDLINQAVGHDVLKDIQIH